MYEKITKPLENGAAKILETFANTLYGKPSDLARNSAKRNLRLPRDLYAHADAQTEWWYYTGHCKTVSGKRFGFELVFFSKGKQTTIF